MKSTVTILIVEPNLYFAHGFIQGILKHFDGLEIPLMFTQAFADKSTADMIFMADELEGAQRRYLTQRETAPAHQRIYVFKEKLRQIDRTQYKDLNGIFVRYQRLDCAVEFVAKELQKLSLINKQAPQPVIRIFLTERERQILGYLSTGQSSREISRALNISQKTVSGHKRNAMSKLGLNRSSDLNYWLLRGGINQLAHMSSPNIRPIPSHRSFSPWRPFRIPSLRPLRPLRSE